MDIDYCGMLYNGLASSYATSPYFDACAFPKLLAIGQVDLSKVKSIDCGNTYCRSIFQSLTSLNQVEQYSKCSLVDTTTSTRVSLMDVSTLCAGAPTTTAATSIGGSPITLNPWTPPSSIPGHVAQSDSGGNSTTTIIAIVVVVVVACVVGGIVYVRTKRRREIPPNETPTGGNFVEMEAGENFNSSRHGTGVSKQSTRTGGTTTTTSSSMNSMSFQTVSITSQLDMCDIDMYRIPSNEVRMIKPLAQGAYGEVWLGECMGSMIAIKRLLPSKCSLSDLQKFIFEIKLLSKIESPYIVRFVGVAWSKPSDMQLLTEFMDGGDLRNMLDATSKKKTTFTWVQKLKCALNVAEGLVYLHLMDPCVIHRDLKSRNVLLDSTMGAKITDFGIARETDDATMTAGIGTYRWIAPEVLMDGHYSESADIFSFGVIMSELCTEVVPYSDLRNASGNPYTDTAIMAKVMAGELIPSFPGDCPTWFVDLGRVCMALDPNSRPMATQVAFQIRSYVEGFI